MIIAINQLANLCLNGEFLTPELIKNIDELTHSYGSKFQCDKASICSESWKVIQNSVLFWQNTFVLLTNTQYDETKLQALVLIHNRIKKNWFFQAENIRSNAKVYLCNQAQNFGKNQMTKTRRSIFRKINHIIVQILKYQWMGDWNNFLGQICEAVEQNTNLAQNYFDLLSVIFQQIFTQKDKIISEQSKKITQQVVSNYGKIQKAFEKYLVPQCPPNILKNAMIALKNLIQWIPAYYIFFGLLIDKLLVLLFNQKNQKEILDCLLTILLLPNDEILEQYIAKAYVKKRQILFQILSIERLKKNVEMSNKTLITSYKLLEQQQGDIKKYGEKLILTDSREIEGYHNLLKKIVEWTNENVTREQAQHVLGLYKYITTVKNQQIFPNIIDLTPCPFDTSFFLQRPIFKVQFSSSDQLVQDRNNFTQMMKNLITHHEQQYYIFITGKLNDDFTRSKAQTKRLWKLLWNIYYFIEISKSLKNIKAKVFTIVAKLLQLQQRIEQKMFSVQDKKLLPGLLLCDQSVKLGLILIYSNSKSIKNLQVSLYVKYVINQLIQDNIFIKALIDIVSTTYNYLSLQDKLYIHGEYLSQMRDRKDRVEVDIKYIVLLGKWVSVQGQYLKQGLKMIKNILQFYESNVGQLRKAPKNNSNGYKIQKIQKIQQEIIKQVTSFLKLSLAVIPQIKCQVIFQNYDFINIIRQFIIKQEIKQNNQSYIEYFILSSKIFIASFTQLSLIQINNNIDVIISQNMKINQFYFQLLHNCTLSEQIIQSILYFLGHFILCFPKWNYDLHLKYQIITKIIKMIYNINYSFDVPGYTQFINKVVKCSILPYLQQTIISHTLNKIFLLTTFQSEQKTYKALQILKNLLTQSISCSAGQNMLFAYIVQFIIITYTLLIKVKNKDDDYISQFSDVMFMSIVFLKSMKIKLIQNQTDTNLQKILMVLKAQTRKIYPNYQQFFLKRVDQLLDHIVTINSKQQFKQKAKDLVIILKRGY